MTLTVDRLVPSSAESQLRTGKRSSKLYGLAELATLLPNVCKNSKIIHCHGVFDLLHIGHIRHFKQAKDLGGILVVSLTADEFVNKGPGRPVFNQYLRAEAIASLKCVDYVVINQAPTAENVIRAIKPNYYVKGDEYQNHIKDVTGKISSEEAEVKLAGGEIAYTSDITFSSSTLLNKYFPAFPQETLDYLDTIKQAYTSQKMIDYIEGAQHLSVMLVGEAIIDEYTYCSAIGKSGKEPVLATKYLESEKYAGGILAIANHIADFVKEVECVTYIGEDRKYKEYIEKNLKRNVKARFIYKKNSPTLVKRRYVEKYLKQKMFEVYEINDDPLCSKTSDELIDGLRDKINDYDLVLVADYGHGLLNTDFIKFLTTHSKFLSVNTQVNAGNRGFNLVTKYPKADYVSIAAHEMELALRERGCGMQNGIKRLCDYCDYKTVTITNGKYGSFVYKQGEEIVNSLSLANHVNDRVGAGDAVLAISTLLAYQDAPADVIGFVGNVVGAEAVTIMGNERFIEKIPLIKHITHLMK